jgi:hypothetical protein
MYFGEKLTFKNKALENLKSCEIHLGFRSFRLTLSGNHESIQESAEGQEERETEKA